MLTLLISVHFYLFYLYIYFLSYLASTFVLFIFYIFELEKKEDKNLARFFFITFSHSSSQTSVGFKGLNL